MLKKILISICFIPLLAALCNKEREGCHHNIKFKNNSGAPIIFAYKYAKDDGCMLDGWKVESGHEFNIDSRYCYENYLQDGRKFEAYIADPASYVNQLIVDCDSISDKYPVLKHYDLSLEEIKQVDFKIIFQ